MIGVHAAAVFAKMVDLFPARHIAMHVRKHDAVHGNGLPIKAHARVRMTATGRTGRGTGPVPATGRRVNFDPLPDFLFNDIAPGHYANPPALASCNAAVVTRSSTRAGISTTYSSRPGTMNFIGEPPSFASNVIFSLEGIARRSADR